MSPTRWNRLAPWLMLATPIGCVLPGCNPGTTVPGPIVDDTTNNDSEPIEPFLPEAITIDVTELPEEDDSTSGKLIPTFQTGPAAYDRTLRAASQIVHAFQRIADKALTTGAAIREDITSADVTHVADDLTVNGMTVLYKADFSPFDIDGDGTVDGSGTFSEDPVALRMWVDRGEGYQRFLCALVTARPSAGGVGAGTLFVHPHATDENAVESLNLKTHWDRTDPAHGWNEAFVTGMLRTGVDISIGYQRVDVRTFETGLEKTIRSSSVFDDSPWDFEEFASSVHFRRGGISVLVSALSTGGLVVVDVAEDCVSIAQKILVDASLCEDLDTQDTPFLAMPVGGEADFPADFPETPTF